MESGARKEPCIRRAIAQRTPTHSGAFGGSAAISVEDYRPVALRPHLSAGLPLSEQIFCCISTIDPSPPICCPISPITGNLFPVYAFRPTHHIAGNERFSALLEQISGRLDW